MNKQDKQKVIADCLREIKMELRATREMLIARYGEEDTMLVMQEIYKKLQQLEEEAR